MSTLEQRKSWSYVDGKPVGAKTLFVHKGIPAEELIGALASNDITVIYFTQLCAEHLESLHQGMAIFLGTYLYSVPGGCEYLKSKNIAYNSYYHNVNRFQDLPFNLGRWDKFLEPNTAANQAFQYVKTLYGEKLKRAVQLEDFDEMAIRGSFFRHYENNVAGTHAENVLKMICTVEKAKVRIAAVSIGCSTCVDQTHKQILKLHKEVDFSVIHYYRIYDRESYNGSIVNYWSVRGRIMIPPDSIFERLECTTFDPIAIQRGGYDGVHFTAAEFV